MRQHNFIVSDNLRERGQMKMYVWTTNIYAHNATHRTRILLMHVLIESGLSLTNEKTIETQTSEHEITKGAGAYTKK